MASNFVDRVVLHVSAGDGGHGVGGDAKPGLCHALVGTLAFGRARAVGALRGLAVRGYRLGHDRIGARQWCGANDADWLHAHPVRRQHVGVFQHRGPHGQHSQFAP